MLADLALIDLTHDSARAHVAGRPIAVRFQIPVLQNFFKTIFSPNFSHPLSLFPARPAAENRNKTFRIPYSKYDFQFLFYSSIKIFFSPSLSLLNNQTSKYIIPGWNAKCFVSIFRSWPGRKNATFYATTFNSRVIHYGIAIFNDATF
jgi:hypothetical protein